VCKCLYDTKQVTNVEDNYDCGGHALLTIPRHGGGSGGSGEQWFDGKGVGGMIVSGGDGGIKITCSNSGDDGEQWWLW
jgi:hypothetical protein